MSEVRNPDVFDLINSSRWDEVRSALFSSDSRHLFLSSNMGGFFGDNPFLRACFKKNVPSDVLLKMIELDGTNLTAKMIESGRQRFILGSPLHLACESGSVGTVKALLNATEDARGYALMTDGVGRLPIDVLWRKFLDPRHISYHWVRNRAEECVRGLKNLNEIASIRDLGGEVMELFQKTTLLLLAGNRNAIDAPVMDGQPWYAVHVAAGSSGDDTCCCPSVVLWMMLKLYPYQACLPDENGNLPLHVAAKSPIARPFEFLERRYSGIFSDEESTELQSILSAINSNSIDMLLQRYPRAAKILNSDGRLPIHLAIESGKDWDEGVESLVKAAPEAINSRDVKSHLFPCMLAAITPGASLDVIYRLLQASPNLVVGGIRPSAQESYLEAKLLLAKTENEELSKEKNELVQERDFLYVELRKRGANPSDLHEELNKKRLRKSSKFQ